MPRLYMEMPIHMYRYICLHHIYVMNLYYREDSRYAVES